MSFYSEFSRHAAYEWFIVVIVAFMVRTDTSGVTGIIRDLNLDPKLYETLVHFFHADSYVLEMLQQAWMKTVAWSGCLYLDEGLAVFIIDGVKQLKEGRKTPGVKKLHQESEDSSKANYIYGHLYGVLGVLTGNVKKMFCTPVTASIQSGVATIRKWENAEYEEQSHVVTMILEACYATAVCGASIVLADRYFLSVPALAAWLAYEKETGKKLLSIVTRAKLSSVAYLRAEVPQKPGRGRPRKKGKKVYLLDFFKDTSAFTEAVVSWYGKTERIQYFSQDLLWGKKLYQELRFVFVRRGDALTILVSTNLSFSPERIIRLYGYRFKIEVTFKAMKQLIKGFFSHFWSKAMPELNRYAPKGTPDPLEAVTDKKGQKAIVSALKAIESHAHFGCMAIGMLQMIALLFSHKIDGGFRWLRTKSNEIPSEATIADYMRKSVYWMFHHCTQHPIIEIILQKQLRPDVENRQKTA